MKLLTLTGPSCSGKTTILNELVANHGFNAIVSHTTRAPRNGEIAGIDYHFVNEDQFQKILSEQGFIEYINFNGASYGVSIDEVEKSNRIGKFPVLIVEPNGLNQVSKYCKIPEVNVDLLSVYIGGDTVNLINRYLERATLSDFEDPKKRIIHAKRLSSISNEREVWPYSFEYDLRFNHMDEEVFKTSIYTISKLMKEETNGKN